MILSFRHRGLKRLYYDDDASKLAPEQVERIRTILGYLDGARSSSDLLMPTLALHALRGERRGEWAVTVRANWRITFRFEEGNVIDVNLEDYH